MEQQHMNGDLKSRESKELVKVSELLKILAEYETPSFTTNKHIRPPYINSPVSKYMQHCTYPKCCIRCRAVLSEDLSVLVNRSLERRDHLKESLSACIAAVEETSHMALSQKVSSTRTVFMSYLMQTCPAMSRNTVSAIRDQAEEHQPVPHISDEWTQQLQPASQGPCKKETTTEWFFEDLADLQRKLFLGASKKCGLLHECICATSVPNSYNLNITKQK